MVHIPPKKIHSIDPESRVAEIGLLDAEIVTLRADNRSLRAMNKVLNRTIRLSKKRLKISVRSSRAITSNLRLKKP